MSDQRERRPSGGVPAAARRPVPGRPPYGRMAVHAGLALLGVLTGVAGSLVQGGWFPFGLLLALAGTAALFWGGALLTRSRAGAALPAGGWALAVLLLTTSRPEGDYIFASGAGSYLFLLGGMLLAVAGTVLAPAGRPVFSVPEPPAR